MVNPHYQETVDAIDHFEDEIDIYKRPYSICGVIYPSNRFELVDMERALAGLKRMKRAYERMGVT